MITNVGTATLPPSLGRVAVTRVSGQIVSMAAIPNEKFNELCTTLSHGESLVLKMMSVRASCCFYSIAALCLETKFVISFICISSFVV